MKQALMKLTQDLPPGEENMSHTHKPTSYPQKCMNESYIHCDEMSSVYFFLYSVTCVSLHLKGRRALWCAKSSLVSFALKIDARKYKYRCIFIVEEKNHLNELHSGSFLHNKGPTL